MIHNPAQHVRSKHNIFSFVFVALGGLISLGMLYASFDSLVIQKDNFLLALIWLGAGALLSYITLIGFSAMYEISLHSITKRSLFGTVKTAWSQVQEVWVQPNYFGSFNVSLIVAGRKRHVALLTSLVGNRKEVAQAIIEAATTANPHVELRGWGEKAYGPPPYGIFTEK